MNRYSYMLLDKMNDAAVKQLFEYCRGSLPVPEDVGNFDANYLCTLGRLYDGAMLGNAYDIDRRLASRIAGFMYDYSQLQPDADDAWFYCTSYVVQHVAGEIGERPDLEIARHIA